MISLLCHQVAKTTTTNKPKNKQKKLFLTLSNTDV